MSYRLEEQESNIVVEILDQEIYESFNQLQYSELFNDLSDRKKNVILDFTHVEIVDSLFIGSMIRLSSRLIKSQNCLELSALNPYLKNLLQQLHIPDLIFLNQKVESH